MANRPVEKSVGVINIPLGACLTGTTTRMVADLHEAAYRCNLVRDAMVRFWERWHEDNPGYQPRQRTTRGTPKFIYRSVESVPDGLTFGEEKVQGKKQGRYFQSFTEDRQYEKRRHEKTGEIKYYARSEPLLEEAWLPQHLEKEMQDHGKSVAPNLYVSIVSATIFREVKGELAKPTPSNYKGKSKFVWESILKEYKGRPNHQSENVPIPHGQGVICYHGHRSADVSKPKDAELSEMGRSSCVLSFPLFSKDSGRSRCTVICRLEIGAMSKGHRALLMRIAERKNGWAMCDSKLFRKEVKIGNKIVWRWHLQLCYEQPGRNLGLDTKNIATFEMDGPESNRPFRVSHEEHSWKVGDSYPLLREYGVLDTWRCTMRYRRGHVGDVAAHHGVQAGHGKKQLLRNLRPKSRAKQDLQRRFDYNAIKEIMKFCTRNNCGTLVYKQPTIPLRAKSWFARARRNGIPFGWDQFCGELGHKCSVYGIKLVIEHMGVAEYFQRHKDKPDDNKPAAEPKPQTGTETLHVNGNGKIKRRSTMKRS